MAQCKANKQDGQRCRANALSGSRFCISHDPKAADIKRKAVIKGGRNRRTPARFPRLKQTVRIESVFDVQQLVFETLARVGNGTLDAGHARTIGYLALTCAKISEVVEIQQHVCDLEERVIQLTRCYEGQQKRRWA